MEAKQNSIPKFMQQQDAKFFIPVYQRNYDWKYEQCKQLFSDILKSGSDDKIATHFIGSIVYIQLNLITGSPELTIIDGQQRLTTLTLFIAALAKRAEESGNSELSKKLKTRYLINDELEDDEKLKLKPIKKDDISLKYILGLYHSEINEFSRIVENYNYFYENILLEQIELLYNGFIKLIFIEIALDKSKDDPQKIFQSLNSTGLDLSQADLIRNYILMGLDYKIQQKIYEKYWVEIENHTTEELTKTNRMSDFIRDYLTFKFNSIPNQNKVFEVFKDRFEFHSENDLSNLLDEIKKYSKFYMFLINPEFEPNPKIRENLYLIKKLQINVSYPFIMQIYKLYDDKLIDADTFNEVLEIVQSFVWRRFICNVATNALNKIFMDLFRDVDLSDIVNTLYKSLIFKKGSQRFPDNEEISRELEFKDMYNIQPKNKTYFLERIENYGHKIKTTIENNPDVSIEHIFPQNPGYAWREELNDEFELMKKYINTAANLSLSAFNRELSNSVFQKKRDLPEKGYKFSPLRMDKFLCNFDYWNIETLRLRKEWMIDRFKTIWKYPELEFEERQNEDNRDVDILDIDSIEVTSKKIDYFIFFDTKYEKASYQSLFQTVVKIMFEREPNIFFGADLVEYLKLTQNPNELRNSLKISQVYYIERNLSAAAIVKRIQTILIKCETDDILLIKLKDE